MKKLVIAMSLLSAGSAFSGELDGKNFCRTVQTAPLFGQPAGSREHCVSFEADMMKDNANTFFGNPPENNHYVLVAGKILAIRKGSLVSDYVVDPQMTSLKNSAGATLELK